MPPQAIGWAASFILFITILSQIRAQWRAKRTESVSPWLFIGQLTADAGFVVYSALMHDWVFIVTNAVLAVTAIVGWVVLVVHRRREQRGPAQVEAYAVP